MKKLFNSIDTIIRWLENIVCGATLTAIVCIATATVIARYIFQTGFLWADEVNQALLVAMGMFGSARAVRTNGHTEFTMLVNKPKSKAVRIALDRTVYRRRYHAEYHAAHSQNVLLCIDPDRLCSDDLRVSAHDQEPHRR